MPPPFRGWGDPCAVGAEPRPCRPALGRPVGRRLRPARSRATGSANGSPGRTARAEPGALLDGAMTWAKRAPANPQTRNHSACGHHAHRATTQTSGPRDREATGIVATA